MENKDNLQDELSSFRQQWQEEIQQRSRSNSPQLPQENTSSENAGVPDNQSLKNTDDESNESKAKVLFLNGVSLEQKGRMPEAIRYYRQAIQLVPDIESRISDFNELLPAKSEPSQELFTDVHDDEDDGTTNNHNVNIYVSKDLENVVKEFDKMNVNGICSPEFPTSKTHISALPAELLMYIFKWVVSLRLDLRSLEKLAQVCKGFYALARDPEIWRLVCLRVWGVNLGSAVSWNGSWREMYLKRAHLLYNGVYISKISYTRPTERTFEQQYTPYQLIIYYRYLRFFTDGSVLFLTTPDEPQVSVSRLSQMNESTGNVWNGNYRLVGNKVLLVIHLGENVGYSSRRRGRRPAPQNNERVFHMELQLQNTKKKQNNKLTWVQYTCQTICRYTGQRTVSQFDLNNEQFCAFYFSRVKSYESFVSAPLGLGSG